MSESVFELFAQLTSLDDTLAISREQIHPLLQRRVVPQPYRRETLFENMSLGVPSLFNNYPPPLVDPQATDSTDHLVQALSQSCPRRKIHVRCGPSQTIKYLGLKDLLHQWSRDRSRVGVTDLHIRGTRIESVIDPSHISEFNLLRRGDREVSAQEMMTAVISSSGTVSDSHSDDPDGSNHCLVGRKVWLIWDTFEGLRSGLEDVERVDVTTRCSFDMERFLALPSARWFTVEPGNTLFLPGSFTHKVITVEKYLGVGGFYLSFPNALRSFSRWHEHGPLWALNGGAAASKLLAKIAKISTVTTRRFHAAESSVKRAWGYDYLRHSLEIWQEQTSVTQRHALEQIPWFNEFVAEAQRARTPSVACPRHWLGMPAKGANDVDAAITDPRYMSTQMLGQINKHVYIAESAHGGLGQFAKSDIPVGRIVGYFSGRVLNAKTWFSADPEFTASGQWTHPGSGKRHQYRLEVLSPSRYMNGGLPVERLPNWRNHPMVANVRLEAGTRKVNGKPRFVLVLRTSRSVEMDAELLLDYGVLGNTLYYEFLRRYGRRDGVAARRKFERQIARGYKRWWAEKRDPPDQTATAAERYQHQHPLDDQVFLEAYCTEYFRQDDILSESSQSPHAARAANQT